MRPTLLPLYTHNQFRSAAIVYMLSILLLVCGCLGLETQDSIPVRRQRQISSELSSEAPGDNLFGKRLPLIVWDLGGPSLDNQPSLRQVRASSATNEDKPLIYLDHVRKAGGSTARDYVKQVCKRIGCDDDGAFIAEGSALNARAYSEVFGPHSTIKFSLITLRDPVSRVESWARFNIVRTADACIKNNTFRRRLFDCEKLKSSSAEELMEEMLSQSACYSTSPLGEPKNPTWDCAENYYVKNLVGTKADHPNNSNKASWAEVTEDDVMLAKKRLQEFSGVLITEWMSEPDVETYLTQSVFHLSGHIPMRHVNEINVKILDPKLGEFVLSQPQRDTVTANNWADLELYKFAQDLLAERMKAAGLKVPNMHLSKEDGDNESEAAIDIGTQVMLDGLVDKPDWNGRVGTVVEYVDEKARWAVQFDDGKIANFKADHLKLTESSRSKATPQDSEE